MVKQKIQPSAVLKEVGEALYPGQEDWRAKLADDLHVLPSSVKQWEKGHLKFDVYSHGAVDDMIRVMTERRNRLNFVIQMLHKTKLSVDNPAFK